MKATQTRALRCAHTEQPRVDDYGDDRRWRVRCPVCNVVERWTQSEWRGLARPLVSVPLTDLLVVADD